MGHPDASGIAADQSRNGRRWEAVGRGGGLVMVLCMAEAAVPN
jgi:hypothetical protein